MCLLKYITGLVSENPLAVNVLKLTFRKQFLPHRTENDVNSENGYVLWRSIFFVFSVETVQFFKSHEKVQA